MRLGHWLAGVLGMSGIVGLGTLLLADDYAFPQQPRYRGEPARTVHGRFPPLEFFVQGSGEGRIDEVRGWLREAWEHAAR